MDIRVDNWNIKMENRNVADTFYTYQNAGFLKIKCRDTIILFFKGVSLVRQQREKGNGKRGKNGLKMAARQNQEQDIFVAMSM